MKSLFYSLAFIAISSICSAADERESDYPLIAGQYEVIGRKCDSGLLFAGTITIVETNPNMFVVTRIIDGEKIIGSGKVEFATPDKIPVFRVQFVEDGKEFEGTFLWRGDLNNDGRISGYVHTKGYEGKKPGLEALFSKKEAEPVAGQPTAAPESKQEGGDPKVEDNTKLEGKVLVTFLKKYVEVEVNEINKGHSISLRVPNAKESDRKFYSIQLFLVSNLESKESDVDVFEVTTGSNGGDIDFLMNISNSKLQASYVVLRERRENPLKESDWVESIIRLEDLLAAIPPKGEQNGTEQPANRSSNSE